MKRHLTRLIEGSTGIPALTAMLNSPIDVDKIDYVFRDCSMLNRSIHLPTIGSEAERAAWFAGFIEDQIVLPSGLVALYGRAGEKARELLEERWYLYRNVYFHPAFRAVEKIVRSVLTFWLCRIISRKRTPAVGEQEHLDPRPENGVLARSILWGLLTNANDGDALEFVHGGEGTLIQKLCSSILGDHPTDTAFWKSIPLIHLPLESAEREWFARCGEVLGSLIRTRASERRTMDQFEQAVREQITVSQPVFISRADFKKKVRDIIRVLEYDYPFTALIDAAVMPRMLSYASQWGSDSIAECYVVPRADPEHWNQRPPARWCPLSQTTFAERDVEENRQVQVLVVSPRNADYNMVGHVLDRLRNACSSQGIKVSERMGQF
jgi:hypothetical protein